MFQKMMEEAVVKEVTEIVGEEHITVKEFDLVPYTLDALSYSFENGCSADVVVLPKSTLEVSKIVKLANKRRTPVTPGSGN